MKSSSMSPVVDQQVQQPVEQREIGAGLDRQVQVGPVGGGGAPRVHHDEFGARLEPVGHPQEQDRMAVRHVRADDEEQVGGVEVGVGAGRAVGAQGLLVSGAGAGHAQPGVRLDVHGAQIALGQFGRQVLGLQRHLPGHVQRDGVGAVGVEMARSRRPGFGDRLVHRHRCGLSTARAADQCGGQPVVGRGHQLGVGGALGAQPAEVGGVQLVAADLRDDGQPGARIRGGAHLHAAAHSAVGARGAGGAGCRHVTIVSGHCSGSFEATLARRKLHLTASPAPR